MRFSDLDGAAVGVWGAGRETRSFAERLRALLPGARIAVVAFDSPPAAGEAEAVDPGAAVAVGGELTAALAGCDAVVRSPAVSIHRPEIAALRERGVPVATATGLWLAERGGRGVVGITGTKGKSTTTALAQHLARAAGRDTALAGNIGVPAIDLLGRERTDLVFLELSSYQIADLPRGPETVVFTNLFREHTDWHGGERAYREEKLRVLGLPGVRAAVVNAREPELARAAAGLERVTLFGEPSGWDGDEGGVRRAGRLAVGAADLPLPGAHNALNLCAALAALELAGIDPPLPEGLRGFEALPHRLRVCGERDGVTWVDDSISTTPESALAALEVFAGRDLVLLAGGLDRGQDYTALGAALARAGAAVMGMPSTGERAVAAARAAGVPEERAVLAEDLVGAVAAARRVVRPGGVILLSPAAPSFDRFRDFEERGERFRALM